MLSPSKLTRFLHEEMGQVEIQSWSNEQYSRHGFLEICGIPESVSNSSLEEIAQNIFEDLDVNINPVNIDAFHHVGLSS